MYPYLDLTGFKARTTLVKSDVDFLEAQYPGWLVQTITSWTSRINAQLRKRYGQAKVGQRNALPLGQDPPELLYTGSSAPGAAPALALVGRPTVGSMQIVVQVTTPGALGTAAFQWSKDKGVTWEATGVPSAASVVLTGSGLTLTMADVAYATSDSYEASTPVPETVLQWLAILVSWDAFTKRGRNPEDPLIADLRDDRTRVLTEVDQAANSNDGRFDLPINEEADSAVTTGGPLFYTESSPFVSADRQERDGRLEDEAGFGTVIR